jgi:ketosteroid isomerase-like protein
MADLKEIVTRYYELANSGQWDAWCDLFAPDQVMDEQMAGHIEGRAALRAVVRGFPTTFTSFRNEPRHFVFDAEQGTAAAVSHLTVVTAASGVTVQVDVCNYFRMADGLIAYMSNYHDTAPFAAAAPANG